MDLISELRESFSNYVSNQVTRDTLLRFMENEHSAESIKFYLDVTAFAHVAATAEPSHQLNERVLTTFDDHVETMFNCLLLTNLFYCTAAVGRSM